MSPSLEVIAKCPDCTHKIIYTGTAKRPRITCEKCKKRFYIKTQLTQKEKIVKKTQDNFIPPKIVDDPDELLMSVAIRELNRANPDPRWASILISCKKEHITNKSEVLDQFKQLPTKVLVTLLSKNLQEEL